MLIIAQDRTNNGDLLGYQIFERLLYKRKDTNRVVEWLYIPCNATSSSRSPCGCEHPDDSSSLKLFPKASSKKSCANMELAKQSKVNKYIFRIRGGDVACQMRLPSSEPKHPISVTQLGGMGTNDRAGHEIPMAVRTSLVGMDQILCTTVACRSIKSDV